MTTPCALPTCDEITLDQHVCQKCIPIKTTPDQALLDELYRTAGEVAWLDAKVRELNELDLIWNKTRTKRSYDDPETIYEAKPSTWYLLWRDARDRLVRVAEACKKANIEERRIQLAEDQGRLIAGVLQRIFNRLDPTDSQQNLIPIVVPEELRALTHKETEQ